jgi:hypothetical protein
MVELGATHGVGSSAKTNRKICDTLPASNRHVRHLGECGSDIAHRRTSLWPVSRYSSVALAMPSTMMVLPGTLV